jgi:predicted GIY-YIG superfamily endonuclease
MPERIFYVYILASEKNGTLYVGFTGNLEVRTAPPINSNYSTALPKNITLTN